MDFGHAFKMIMEGKKVSRQEWVGKGIWIVLVKPVSPEHTQQLGIKNESGFYSFINGPMDHPMPTLPFIAMRTREDNLVPWSPNQLDILAQDWAAAQ